MPPRVKFTSERIEQIKNLVEHGKRREEIAELIGVTVGSLQVTCSRLGISLRRPRLKPVPTPPSKPAKAADVPRFAISMRYRGEERTTELPLTQDMISQLAVEAAFRGVPICDLIGDLIMEMLRRASTDRGQTDAVCRTASPEPNGLGEARPSAILDAPCRP
jgi:hypothetical protein